ncbi:DNA mismatch repair protein msh3 [Phycomyces blakesleeanus]|uniref:MutS protein homolog 3 n=1 Tax=Phycomyces blakesleeanus TaxID=4837 RepID=A0ABR3ARS5_PHYBL
MSQKQQMKLGTFFKRVPQEPKNNTPESTTLNPTTPTLAHSKSVNDQIQPTGSQSPSALSKSSMLPSAENQKNHDQFVSSFGDIKINRTKGTKRKQNQIDQEEPRQQISSKRSNTNTKKEERLLQHSMADNESSSDVEMSDHTNVADVKPVLKQSNKILSLKKTDDSIKYTPLESQVVKLKEEYPGVLLAVEVGYKYRFFGEDAVIASRTLRIAHWVDHNFTVASIPVHRLQVHLHRLVDAGYKVGVVCQTETAALKSAGPNKSAPFQRELKQLYTKSTFFDGFGVDQDENGSGPSHSNYLMTIIEENRGKNKTSELAVNPATGDVIYDVFEDGFMRSELETRMLHIEPCELLLPFKLSKPTEKIIGMVTSPKTTSPKERARIERIPENETISTDYNTALSFLTEFYAHGNQDNSESGKSGFFYSDIVELPYIAIKALAATAQYLRQFRLDHSIKLTKYFINFSARGHMLLNGNTMTNLEIYRNSIDNSYKGSLLSILDKTVSPFGKRLLKKWVGRPLINVDQLKIRTDALEELVEADDYLKKDILNFLKHLPDIERDLCRIQYGRSSPKELLGTLEALVKISGALDPRKFRFNSRILTKIIDTLPTARHAQDFKDCLNQNAIGEKNCKHNLFISENQWPDIPMHKQNIARVRSQLEEYLEQIKVDVNIPTLRFVDVSGIEYLLEVKNSMASKVPIEWVKMSATKAVSRFHTRFVSEKLKELELSRALLDIAAENAYQDFLRTVSDRYEVFRDVVQSLAELDCLLSLADTALRPDYVRPVFSDHVQIKVKNGRHPMVEQFTTTDYIPNDINFDTDEYRTMILTGPNMGGKSSYIRQVALISIMGQIGSYVPAESAELGILDAVYTRMGAMDNALSGESTFMVELHETSDIMKQATPRSLVILDELGRGTSTHDGMAIAYAVLHRFITKIQSITLFVTHYPSLGGLAKEYPESTTTGHMSFIEEDVNDIPSVIFLYKMVPGISLKSYGLNVARIAGLPKKILAKAKIKSEEMEAAIGSKSIANRTQMPPRSTSLKQLFDESTVKDINKLKQLVRSLN